MKNRSSRPFIVLLLLIIAFLLWTIFKGGNGNTSPPEQAISIEKARILETAYEELRAPIINDSLDIVDSREFWFSLETLEQYFRYVKAEGKKLEKSNLGIRVYLGVYPDEAGYPNPGKTTVFFVPTAEEPGSPLRQGFVPIVLENENIEGVDALNFGHAGQPPKDL